MFDSGFHDECNVLHCSCFFFEIFEFVRVLVTHLNLFRYISALRAPPAETQVDGLPPASSYGGRALGLGMKWLKFEFSDT